jgi:FlaG/FlaF family flagellin (archaellin)
MIHLVDHPVREITMNMWACMRERGKLVPGSHREGHNVFTTTGKNWLSKLTAWQTIAGADVPYTNRRVRWMSVGTGSQLEVANVVALANAAVADSVGNYLTAISAPQTFPLSTSVLFSKEFAVNEITVSGAPVSITEAGLFVDVADADNDGGTEDSAVDPGTTETTLDPAVANNPPVAYKAFEPLTKTVDFTLEIHWELRY